ncbi:MAG: hypothetical protein MUO77_06145 [Anaerolineales bacterium]|nr:hypothetical protein [Anaerolineales bacterium]
MNHQPFETWLLEEKTVSPEQKRMLQSHMKICKYCTALYETGVALYSKPMVAPAPGFTARFKKRLAAQHVAERRYKLWGLIVLILGGTALLFGLAGSTLLSIVNSPAEWLTLGIGYLLFIITSLQAFTEFGLVLLRVVPDFIPPLGWMVIASAIAGFSLLWTVSIWRFTRLPRGV